MRRTNVTKTEIMGTLMRKKSKYNARYQSDNYLYKTI